MNFSVKIHREKLDVLFLHKKIQKQEDGGWYRCAQPGLAQRQLVYADDGYF